MLTPFLGRRGSRFERLKQFYHVRSTLAPLGSIGSIRYSVRSLRGACVIEYVLGIGVPQEPSQENRA
eukprot:1214566-Alexandrium_andersonii.AAC.1